MLNNINGRHCLMEKQKQKVIDEIASKIDEKIIIKYEQKNQVIQ